MNMVLGIGRINDPTAQYVPTKYLVLIPFRHVSFEKLAAGRMAPPTNLGTLHWVLRKAPDRTGSRDLSGPNILAANATADGRFIDFDDRTKNI